MILDPDYARVFTQARCIAWQYGYSASLHGSYTRDLDILLTPWTAEARPNHDQLVRLIAQSCDLRESVKNKEGDLRWTEQPHGRRSISLHFPGFGDRRWVDVSIMPCGVALPALTDEQVKERAAKAGLRWIEPIPDDDGEIGYPGGFDMSSLDEIRALLTLGVPGTSNEQRSRNG